MRLIDADALEKEMCSGCEYNKNKYANCDDCAIANAPTIDAEPVVRCKDCRYYETCNLRTSHWWKGGYTVDIEFCSFGERSEECTYI